MLAVFCFRHVTDSRRISVADSCHSLVTSMAFGLGVLVGRSEGVLFERLSPAWFRADKFRGRVASVAGNASATVLLELLEDDRLLQRFPEVEERVQ
eukprot:4714068-Prorocentrum_lima.AAC.1